MKEYKLNVELSKELYDKCKDMIKIKECYNNVARIYLRHMIDNPENYMHYKIVFGAWQLLSVSRKAYARHCFFMYNDEVVDPMIFMEEHQEKIDNETYLKIKEYGFFEYSEAILRNQPDPYFYDEVEQLYLKTTYELFEKGVALI